jgi:hypothetical protein
MNNGQDRPMTPARQTEPVRADGRPAPQFPQAGAPETGAKRPAEGKPQGGGPGKPRRRRLHPLLRALLWTLRVTIVPLLCIAALIAGLYLGYTKIGGGSPEDVWNWETWLHMFDLIFAES